MKFKLKKLSAFVLIIPFLTACAGTYPQPVSHFEYGDVKKDCEILYAESLDCKSQVELLKSKRNGKITANIFVAVIGLVVFPPLLFALDTKSDEGLEMRAYVARQDVLLEIATDKECEWREKEQMLAQLTMPEIPSKEIEEVEEHGMMYSGTER